MDFKPAKRSGASAEPATSNQQQQQQEQQPPPAAAAAGAAGAGAATNSSSRSSRSSNQQEQQQQQQENNTSDTRATPRTRHFTGYPTGYSPAAAPPAYAHSIYHTGNAAFPQDSHQGAYYTQPVYAAAQPHVIHHTTVVQPNSLPSTLYPAQVPAGAPSPAPAPAPRSGALPMGMVSGTTMAMSTGTLLTTPQSTQHMGAPSVTMPTYRPQGAPGYSYVTPHW
ncbi:hypothetical protein CRUP_010866 [Coryphaenoides rupestris]|nr:hypothetical protein CRUP_010866 [Coryphaenoides rupestris]